MKYQEMNSSDSQGGGEYPCGDFKKGKKEMKLSSVCSYCSVCYMYRKKKCLGLLEYYPTDCVRARWR